MFARRFGFSLSCSSSRVLQRAPVMGRIKVKTQKRKVVFCNEAACLPRNVHFSRAFVIPGTCGYGMPTIRGVSGSNDFVFLFLTT